MCHAIPQLMPGAAVFSQPPLVLFRISALPPDYAIDKTQYQDSSIRMHAQIPIGALRAPNSVLVRKLVTTGILIVPISILHMESSYDKRD
jgi:hypothetical protein